MTPMRTPDRQARLFVGLAICSLAGALAACPAAGAAAPVSTGPCASGSTPGGSFDFDGDGSKESVIGMPGANHGTGAIEVVFGDTKSPAVYQPGTNGIPAMPSGAHFGAVTQALDLNDDKCGDLLVGAPGLTVAGSTEAGGVQVLIGGPAGFTAGPTITQDGTDGLGTATEGAQFGASLSDEGCVSVGAPGAAVRAPGGAKALSQAGEVITFVAGSDGTPTESCGGSPRTMLHPQAGAHFGAVMNADAIGAPDADHGATKDTGYVEVARLGYYGTTKGAHLGSSLAETPHRGDESLNVMVGAPGQVVSGKPGAGAVVQFPFAPDATNAVRDRGPTITTASPGIPGEPTRDAHFGASLTATVFTKIAPRSVEWALFVVGVPGAKVGDSDASGAIDVRRTPLPLGGQSEPRWSRITLASRNVPGAATTAAHFGASLSTARSAASQAHGWLLVGAPGTASGGGVAGAVDRFNVSFSTHITPNAQWLRADRPVPGDRFGAWVE
jgi:hypothetical protein